MHGATLKTMHLSRTCLPVKYFPKLTNLIGHSILLNLDVKSNYEYFLELQVVIELEKKM